MHPPQEIVVKEEDEYEIEDTMSFSPRKACEYLYDQVYATVTNPKVVVGVSFDDAAAVPVLDCDVQLRSVSVLKVSVWPSWLPPYVGGRLHTPANKAIQTAVTAVAASAAASSIAERLASVAAAARPVPSPKLLSGFSLRNVRRTLRLDEVGKKDTVGATILSFARPILVVTTPAALSAFIAVKS